MKAAKRRSSEPDHFLEDRLFPLPASSKRWTLLAGCPEFRLYRMPDGATIIIKSPTIERAFWKAAFVISDADGKKRTIEDRIRLALAIRRLALFTQFCFPDGDTDDGWPVPLTHEIARTLGRLILQALDRKNPQDAVDRCANIFRDALDDVAKEARVRKGGKGMRRSNIVSLIEFGELFFERDRKRPTKEMLQQELISLGTAPKGRNIKSDWRALFDEAGLRDIPEK